eukprot:scaffold14748_cov35-Tisochrysis_lutea.AAC.1
MSQVPHKTQPVNIRCVSKKANLVRLYALLQVDVYSFGVLLNELVTGTRPFFGMTTPVLRVRVALGVARPELPAAAAASSLPEGL